MTVMLKDLYELQLIDTQIERIEKAKTALDNGSSLRAQVDELSSRLSEEEKRLKELQSEYHDQDMKLQSIEAKRQKHRERLFSGTIMNPKELESLRQEIEMLTRNKGGIEETLLKLMDDIESQKSTVTDLEQQHRELKSHLDEHLADYHERLARLDEQLSELHGQRESAVTPIDESLLHDYNALRKKAANLAVVKVEGPQCPGCGVTLTAYVERLLSEGEGQVTCENCGRLLYREPDE